MRAPLRRLLLAVLVAGVALATASLGVADRATADASAKRGDKALKARRWSEAKKEYGDALLEEEGHLGARYGLAEASLGLGARAAAIEAFRRVDGSTAPAETQPPEWSLLPAKARRRLTELEATDAELLALADRQAEALLELARRWTKDDPDVAIRAAKRVLAIRPGDEGATALLGELGADGGGAWTALFDGKDLSCFGALGPDTLVLENGLLIADEPDRARQFVAEKILEGDHDVRIEMRVAKFYAEQHVAFLIAAERSEHFKTQAGLWFGDVGIREVDGQGPNAVRIPFKKPANDLSPKYDPAAWNRYEIQFRGDRTRFLLNGRLMSEHERAKDRTSGRAGIMYQRARLEVRRLEYRQH